MLLTDINRGHMQPQYPGTERFRTFDDRASLRYGMYLSNLRHTLIIKHFIDVNLFQWTRNASSVRLYVGALQFL